MTRYTATRTSQTIPDRAKTSGQTTDTRDLLRRKSRRLIKRAGLPAGDRADVESELCLVLLAAHSAFDPEKGGWLPFVERVLQHGSNNLLRRMFTEKRGRRYVKSLQSCVMIGDEEGSLELSQLITRDHLKARIGVNGRDDLEHVQMRLDMADFIARLPHELRELAGALRWETLLEIARRTGIPRSTLYSRRNRLREAAENVGLAKYLGK